MYGTNVWQRRVNEQATKVVKANKNPTTTPLLTIWSFTNKKSKWKDDENTCTQKENHNEVVLFFTQYCYIKKKLLHIKENVVLNFQMTIYINMITVINNKIEITNNKLKRKDETRRRINRSTKTTLRMNLELVEWTLMIAIT